MDLLEYIQSRATKITWKMERVLCEDRLRELRLISLKKDLRAAFQYLKRGYKKEEDRLFSRVCGDRTRGNGFKLKEGRFMLDIRKALLQ